MSATTRVGVAPASAVIRTAAPPRSRFATATLASASLVALGVGAATVLGPIPFSAAYGIELAGDVNALNETRATGAALLGAGALIAVGALRPRWAAASAALGAAVFLGYGSGRVVSALVDGGPASGLITAAATELVLGAACVAAWLRVRGRATA